MRAAIAALVLIACLAPCRAAQTQTTLFTTEDYRRDQARWTDPAYYLYNTARQLTDMQVENRFGQKGSGADKYNIKSPYPFQTSWEHYEAWLTKANGGTKHTLADAAGLGRRVDGSRHLARQQRHPGQHGCRGADAAVPRVLRAAGEGRGRRPPLVGGGVLPARRLHPRRLAQSAAVRDPAQPGPDAHRHARRRRRCAGSTPTRGTGPTSQQFPQWLGESIGFWDGNALVIHTNQIRQWNATHSLFEWSDQLTAVERYERVGNEIVGEITLVRPGRVPVSAARPAAADARRNADRMVYSTCTDTNGPSSNIYARPDGVTTRRCRAMPATGIRTIPGRGPRTTRIGEKKR